MLMITVETEGASVTLRLEGRLTGPESRELARYRRAAGFERRHQRVSLDLTGVVAVDREGRDFLARAQRRGDRLVGGTMARRIVDEIRAASNAEDTVDDEPGTLHHGRPRSDYELFSP
jgi:hypothetical protein